MPPSSEKLLSLAKKQLQLPQHVSNQYVSNDYLEELSKHIRLYPNDTNFVIDTEPGYGLGSVTCLEVCCNAAVVKLVPCVDLFDGGRTRGYGSLASYRVHIAAHLEGHKRSQANALLPTNVPPVSSRPSARMPRHSHILEIIDNSSILKLPIVKSEPVSPTVKSEPESPKVKFDEPVITRKRPSDLVKMEKPSSLKKARPEGPQSPLPLLTNSLASPIDSKKTSLVRARISHIQSTMISTRRLLQNIQRKEIMSAADITKERRLLRRISLFETEKCRLSASLPASSVMRNLDRKFSISNNRSDGHSSRQLQQQVASGSNMRLDSVPHYGEAMVIDSIAKADDINKFLLAAGNADFFDSEATVERSLKLLGLANLFTVLPGMTVALMSHQVLSLDWMIKQEMDELMQGGVLADEMGLGKTVQMIALIVKNKSKDSKRKANLVVAPLALLDQWQLEIESKTDCGILCHIHHGSGKLTRKSDFEQYDVVLTTFGTLTADYQDPLADKKRRSRKGRNANFIVNDVIEDVKPMKNGAGILFQVEWYRIILDEAHNIRNRHTRVSRAVTELESKYRWCLTGTPIINGLADAYGLLRFLRINPWYDWQRFNGHIVLKAKKDAILATDRLQTIFKTMLLRRKKDTLLGGKRLIELPVKDIQLTKLEFSREERDIYKMLETKSQAIFNKFLRENTVLKNYSQVLVLLLRLRQVCNHPFLIVDENSEDPLATTGRNYARSEYERAVKLMGQNFVDKLVAKMRQSAADRIEAEKKSADASIEDECPICFDLYTDAQVCECGHYFCKECIINVLNTATINEEERPNANERPCPVCRSPVSRGKLFAREAFECRVDDANEQDSNGKTFITIDSDDSDNDGLDDFIVSDEIDVKSHSKTRRRMNVVLDSDGEEYNDVIVRPKNYDKISGAVHRSMPEHEASTKMKKMMALLKKWKVEYPDDKVVIVSQWTRYLNLVSKYLSSENFLHVKYQGDMSRNERYRAVSAFMLPDTKVTIMLMSLKCGGVGLNLTRANRVISLDLSWSSAVEGQSFDRVHRLGQSKAVWIERLVVADTVEDRILELQRHKKMLSDGSLGEGDGKKIGRLSVKELAKLFGLDSRGRVL